MTYLYIALVAFTAGIVLDQWYMRKLVWVYRMISDDLREHIKEGRQHFAAIVSAVADKLK